MNQYRALILGSVSKERRDDRSVAGEHQTAASNHPRGLAVSGESSVNEMRASRLRPFWIHDAHSDSSVLLVTYATSLEYLVAFYFYEAAAYARGGTGRKLLLVPNAYRAACWQSALAVVDEREQQHPEVTVVTPAGVNLPLIMQTTLLLIDAAHLALGVHGPSIEFFDVEPARVNLPESIEYADAITRVLFYRPMHLRVMAQMAGPMTTGAQAELVSLLARWLLCSLVRHIVPHTQTRDHDCAESGRPRPWPFTVIPFAVPSIHQLDFIIDQRRSCLFEVLETQTGVFRGMEQVIVLCPTRRSAERSLATLASRLTPDGPANAVVLPSPLLDKIPEDRRIKLETLSSLLRSSETQRRALLGIGMLTPASGTEAASSQSGRITAAHSDRLILRDLFRTGALRIAVMILSMGNVDSTIHDRGCDTTNELARDAPSCSRAGRLDGRMIQSVHADYLHQILDEMQRANHPVAIVLKTTHWADFHGEPQSCCASVLQMLSRSIFRVAPDPVGSFSLLPGANAGILRVRCYSLHRLIALTCSQSAAWAYLYITGRLYTGDHLCAASSDPAGSAADQPWWMQAVARMAAHGLSMRLLREMNCCNSALVTDTAIAEWIRSTLHFAVSEARRSSPCTCLRSAESLSRALIRKLENAGCILREARSERLTVTMLGLAALKHQISPDTLLRFIRSAYGTPRCIGTFSDQNADEHRFCIGYAPPRTTKRIIFDSHRHSPRCRAVIELLYYVCQAGSENEVCTASLVMNQFVHQGSWSEQTIPFALRDGCLDRLGAGEAAFLLVQRWMAVANPPAAKGIYYAVLSIVHCLCAALSERPTLYRESLVAVLIAWMEKFRNGSEHSLLHGETAGARLEHCLIEWTKRPLASSSASSSPFGT